MSLLSNLRQEISNLLVKKLENLEMTPERASEIAQFIIKALPADLTDSQLEKILPSLDDEFFELAGRISYAKN